MSPDFDGREDQDHREQRQQDGARHEAKEPAADETTTDRAGVADAFEQFGLPA